MSYRFADSLRASSQHNLYVLLCRQWKTPDDGQRNCPKHVEFYSKNKFQKLVHLVGFIVRSIDGSVANTDRRTDSGTDTPAWSVSFPRTSLGLFKRCVSAETFRCGLLTTNRSSGRQGWYTHSCALDGPPHTDWYFINCFDEMCNRPYGPPTQAITSAFPSSAYPTHVTSFVDTPTADIRQVTVAVTCGISTGEGVLVGQGRQLATMISFPVPSSSAFTTCPAVWLSPAALNSDKLKPTV